MKFVPPYESTGAGYVSTGLVPVGTAGGYLSEMRMSDGGRLPVTAYGSETTYECDGFWFNNAQLDVALFGGSRSYGSRCGLSSWSLYNLATSVVTDVGASLSRKTPVAA